MRPSKRATLAPMIALLGAMLLCQANGGCMERGELQCEEAVARIQRCCPTSEAHQINCESFETSCGPVYADIDVTAAHCIREASCADLEARGVCAWVAAGSPASPPPPSTCP